MKKQRKQRTHLVPQSCHGEAVKIIEVGNPAKLGPAVMRDNLYHIPVLLFLADDTPQGIVRHEPLLGNFICKCKPGSAYVSRHSPTSA